MVFGVLAMSETIPAYLDSTESYAFFDLRFSTFLRRTKPSYRLLLNKVGALAFSLWIKDQQRVSETLYAGHCAQFLCWTPSASTLMILDKVPELSLSQGQVSAQ